MLMEDTRRRNEASMARKRANQMAFNPAAANPTGSADAAGSLSPSSTGAMDSLLEKLRAAAPQARDQRDRRRRARLKEKHDVRVASGQKVPDLTDRVRDGAEDGLSDQSSPEKSAGLEGGVLAAGQMDPISEGEDVAERAANMLQGLRDKSETPEASAARPGSRGADGEGGSLRVRRRRESADDERRNRRRRRAADRESTSGTSGEAAAGEDRPNTPPPTSKEETIREDEEGDDTIIADEEEVVPSMRVSPPSPG